MKPLPLSNAQKRLWITQKLAPEHAHNTMRVDRFWGELNPFVLKQSLNEIVKRHESLRTSFVEDDGVPYQVILPKVSINVETTDFTSYSAGNKEIAIQRIATESAYHCFDLLHGPLTSFKLLKLNATEHVLVLTIHHLVNDGWSWGVFSRELEQLYRSGLRGKLTQLPPLKTQYRDYVLMQDKVAGQGIRQSLKYWRSRLKGLSPVELPSDRRMPKEQSAIGAQQSIILHSIHSRKIKELAEKERCTPFTIFLTVLQILLHRCTGQEDIVAGVLLSGRKGHREIQNLIGYFINVLLLRTDLGGGLSFRGLLSKVNTNMREDFKWADLPFEKLVEELQSDRVGDYNPLLHVLVNYKKSAWSNFNLHGLTVKPVDILEHPAHFPLQLNAEERENGFFVQFVYQTEIFFDQRMAHFLAQFVYLLEQIVEHPDRSIQSFSLVTPESSSLLPDPSETITDVPYKSVITRFMERAKTDGATIAVEYKDQNCSYAELGNRVNRLATVLKRNGFGGGMVVGVMGERCIGLVTAIIAVMASGGVVLPIDPTLPRQRRQLFLEEGRARVLLTVGNLAESEKQWLGQIELKVWNLDSETGQPPHVKGVSGDTFDLHEPSPGDPAYIFFTSGSTGIPKGILGLHKGIDHFIDWQINTFDIGIGDRVAQLTHISFDVLLRDLYLPLASGATICVPSEHESHDVLRWLNSARVTVLHTVPTLATAWLVNGTPKGCALRHLRWVFFSGESLPDTLVWRWREVFPKGGKIVNFYGPTETTMIKSWYPVPQNPILGNQPLGLPLPQTQVLVMRNESQLCGIGEVGEIVIRTPYRTAGYLNFPDEPKIGFLPNPNTERDNDLLYFTGDRGCYSPDGLLEMHGRIDEQFKVRGIRVEPDEIAQVLLQHEAVQACCVTPYKDKDNQYRIIAYVVIDHSVKPNDAQLRIFAQEHLPIALVPSVFQYMAEFPRLPNGKVDRKALPEPELSTVQREYIAPRTVFEVQVADIWKKVLGIDQVGINDNFFDLGGHSLKAAQIVSRVNDTFQLELPLKSIFDTLTLGDLADAISQTKNV